MKASTSTLFFTFLAPSLATIQIGVGHYNNDANH
jgi:hypothetical protein